MSYGLTTNYSALNGLGLITGTTSGYGYGYGYYGASDTYTQNAKKSIANNYEVRTTNQSYANKQNTENNTLTANCVLMQDLLKEGRTDDAISIFNDTVETLSEYSQYQGYSEQDIKGLIQEKYMTACNGSTLKGDIAKYADGAFESGLKNSNPITVWFTQTNNKEDFREIVTGEPKDKNAFAMKTAGTIAGGAATAAVGFAAVKNIAKLAGTSNGKKALSAAGGLLSKVAGTSCGKLGLIALAGAAVGAICLGVKSFLNKETSKAS